MTDKNNVEYLRNTIDKWNQILEKLSKDDIFREIINNKINTHKTEINYIVKHKSPEDFI